MWNCRVAMRTLRRVARCQAGSCCVLCWLVVLLIFIVFRDEAAAQPTIGEAVSVRLVADVPYKLDGATRYERERCKLDLYLPEGSQGFATIIWFHGGGLQNGDKAGDIAVGLAKRLSSEGIAVASVNYRLSPQVKFPAYIEDAAAAVAFLHKQISSYGGSDKLIFVSGHSAGGYLTSMIGMDTRYLKAHGLDTDAIAGCVPVSGQMVTHSTVRGERGTPRTQPIIDQAAPAFHARADAAPFLCIAGAEDLPARAEENRYFVAVMKAAGHESIAYLEVEGRDHGTIASRMNEQDDVVATAVKRFIRNVSSTRR